MQRRYPVRHNAEYQGFAGILGDKARVECAGAVDPLAGMDYGDELAAKNAAFAKFWKTRSLPAVPEPILPSPLPRGYRANSKCRVGIAGNKLRFCFDEFGEHEGPAIAESALEPREHAAIYRFLHDKIATPPYHNMARHLNYLIIRGSYSQFAVIFNVDELNAGVVRKIKLLAEHLQSANLAVVSAFIYHDPSRSDYYFEQSTQGVLMRAKTMFGRDTLMTAFSGRRYVYPPTVFSQVNESMLPVMCSTAENVLGEGERLLDLFCGYGLFSHYLAGKFEEIVGVDGSADAIEAAERNTRLNPARARRRFFARDIRGGSPPDVLRQLRQADEAVILDPPRRGTDPGIISHVASRKPHCVLHVFCCVDEIHRAIDEWKLGGYSPARILPLDMFPGTPNLEVLILLRPA